MAAYDDLNIKRIITVGIISVLVTACTALAVQVLYYSMAQWQETATAEQSNYHRQDQILADQTAEISNFGVNPDTGNVTIPINDAINLIVKEKAKQPSEKKSGSDET